MSTFILICAATVLMLWTACEAVLHKLRRRERLTRRLLAIHRPDGASITGSSQQAVGLIGLIGTIGSGMARSGLLSQKTIAGLTTTLGASGLRGPGALEVFVGAKLLLLMLLPLLSMAVLQHFDLSSLVRNVSIAGAALVGLLGPDWWVRPHASPHSALMT